ncbi:polyphosphate kinase [Vandammella animalimorsus]|uniref:Polyphosphate kinase n=1 Tax=Vandammella animalimorsus TaxID=2029117 RepID=A0A2A2T3C9_9BURK|nr:PPK2 family polyphosphate kinase [Vandammella animalimorsus]PAT32677.1 polyphosphate kinase [Vandammella animalimorsus]PAX15947.1 polyphosphate kinase [Vandammella animalimorsus]PAX18083.1 polyphosphate kinase [Vandammella animalimorsus]
MNAFDAYRIRPGHSLADIDPDQTPYPLGSKQAELQRLDELALQLDELQNLLYANGQRKLLLILQGMDTSGKDGTIRWVFSRTSPLGVHVHAFKAPSAQERARDFLWRCHAVVPGAGELTVWNRSHYEDVLVPVVRGEIDERETQRRYAHINHFEQLLSETGTRVLKCLLHISKDEQRRRLQKRLDDPAKQWKFAREDLQARAQWDDYQCAYDALLEATSTAHAPWWVIPADNKRQRNLLVADLLCHALRDMQLRLPEPDPGLARIRLE